MVELATRKLSEDGRPVGESHPRSVATDAKVTLIRDLHEHQGLTINQLAKMFGYSKSVIQKWCAYTRRNTTPRRFE